MSKGFVYTARRNSLTLSRA